MAKYTIYASDGTTIKAYGCPTYNATYLKVPYLEFREISSANAIAWAVGDQVTYQGVIYRLYDIPQVTRNGQSDRTGNTIKGRIGNTFTYSNVQFYPYLHELELLPFLDVVKEDNNIHFSTQGDVSTYENLSGIKDRIQANLDSMVGTGWTIQIVNTSLLSSTDRALIAETKEFTLSKGTIFGALNQIYDVWEGIGWLYDGNKTVTIGAANVSDKSAISTDAFRQGKGNGLTTLVEAQANKDSFGTRLYAYGSDRNINFEYYKKDSTILNAASLNINNLMIPKTYWGQTSGKYDASKAYITNSQKESLYGLRPKMHYYDGNEDEEIYPTIENMTIGEVIDALSAVGQEEYSPNTQKYTRRGEAVDVFKTVNNPSDNGDATDGGKTKYKDQSGTTSSYLQESFATSEDTEVLVGSYTAEVAAEYIITLANFFKITPSSSRTDTDLINSGALSISKFIAYKNYGEDDEVEVNCEASRDSNGNLTAKVSNISLAIDDTITFIACVKAVGTARSAFSHTGGADSIITAEYDGNMATTFTAIMKQVGFNIAERQALGADGLATIFMNSGKCAGRSFVVKSCDYLANEDTWRLTMERAYDESIGTYFPNSNYQMVAETDKFVILDIAMPDSYIKVAETRLYNKAVEYYGKISERQVCYTPSVDSLHTASALAKLKAGWYMQLQDNVLIGYDTDDTTLKTSLIQIDSVSITETDKVPTYRVTLREEKSTTFKKSATTASSSTNPWSSSAQGSDSSESSDPILRRAKASTKSSSGSTESGTTDYDDLENKPQIGGVTLSGNKTASALGLAEASNVYTKTEINDTVVTKAGDQTITGNKTFSGATEFEASVTVPGFGNLSDGTTTALNKFEQVSRKVTSFSNPTNNKYPSALLVKNSLDGKADADDLTDHTENTNNPHGVTKAQVGLSNVPNTDFTDTISGMNTAITVINNKIPDEASSSNKLADKSFVNSSIATNTATFRGTSASGLTEAQFFAWANAIDPKDNNDYIFWNTVDTDGNVLYKRYKYNGTSWVYEYALNNSSFTASQWSAINSGVTSTKVGDYDDHIADTDNPHGVTKAQIGLSNVPNTDFTDTINGMNTAITVINNKIPSAASSSNQLADKAYVTDSIGNVVHKTGTETITGKKIFDNGSGTKVHLGAEESPIYIDGLDWGAIQNEGESLQQALDAKVSKTGAETITGKKSFTGGGETVVIGDTNHSAAIYLDDASWEYIKNDVESLQDALDAKVSTSGAETISGVKTFTGDIKVSFDDLLDRNDEVSLNTRLGAKEGTANKKTSLTDNSDTYYPTQKAVKTAIDSEATTRAIADSTLATYIENETTARSIADDELQDDIDAINAKIPSAATSSNQLADKAFVNSSISTNTATFRGTSPTGLTEVQFLNWANAITTKDLNDYIFWNTVDSIGNPQFKRYKYNGAGWEYEYTLNNSSFTQAQWNAINSGATSDIIDSIDDKENVSNKTNTLTGGSETLYPSVKAVEDAIDGMVKWNLSGTFSQNIIFSQDVTENFTKVKDSGNSNRTLSDYLSAKEETSNKKTSLTDNSDTYYPTQKAVKTAINSEATTRAIADSTLATYIENETTARSIADDELQDDIDAINAKIPTAASSSNQLADKTYVNSLIGSASAFKATYGTTTYAQVETAYNAGKVISVDYSEQTYYLTTAEAGNFVFTAFLDEGSGDKMTKLLYLDESTGWGGASSGWDSFEMQANKDLSIPSGATNYSYPSTKAVKDYVDATRVFPAPKVYISNHYIYVYHPMLGITGYEAVLMVYRSRNGRRTHLSSSDTWTHRRGWGVAYGNLRTHADGYFSFNVAPDPYVPNTKRRTLTDLFNFIVQRFCRVQSRTKTQMNVMTYSQFIGYDSDIARGICSDFDTSDITTVQNQRNSISLGIAIRTTNPAFTAKVVGSLDDTTTQIDGVNRWIYSEITEFKLIANQVKGHSVTPCVDGFGLRLK